MNYYSYGKLAAIAFCFSITNLLLTPAIATAESDTTNDKSATKLSSLDLKEGRSLRLNLLLAHRFNHHRQTINLQSDNFHLLVVDQKIPLRNQPLIASSFSGKASWYGPGFHGRLTANGERYNQNAMTAAHKHLRFGTRVRVTNLNNGRSVVVRINDRGPFVKGRVIDLSAAAARSLNMMHSGVVPVTVKILGQ